MCEKKAECISISCDQRKGTDSDLILGRLSSIIETLDMNLEDIDVFIERIYGAREPIPIENISPQSGTFIESVFIKLSRIESMCHCLRLSIERLKDFI